MRVLLERRVLTFAVSLVGPPQAFYNRCNKNLPPLMHKNCMP